MAHRTTLTKKHVEIVQTKLRELGVCVIRSQTGKLFVTVGGNDTKAELYEYDENRSTQLVNNLLFNKGTITELAGVREVLRNQAFNAGSAAPQIVSTRVAEREGKMYLDLCNPDRQVVEITAAGWDVVTSHPVKFCRPPGALPLPVPKRGGNVESIRQILGITDSRVLLLVLGWLCAAFKENGEHLLLALQGDAGGGKSTLGRNLVRFLDPRDPPLIQMQFKADDLMLSAANRWIFGLDEVDGLTKDKTRVLAGICTGAGREARLQYSNEAVSSTTICRPTILTGMEGLLDEERVRDRAILVEFRKLAPEQRLTQSAMDKAFAAAHPEALGALLDLISGALRHSGEVIDARENIRMTEAGEFAEKCLQAGGYKKGEFVQAVKASQQSSAANSTADWVVLPALTAIAKAGFGSSPQELHAKLTSHKLANRFHRDWPKAANKLTAELGTRDGDLRELGIVIERKKKSGGQNWVSVRYVPVTEATPAVDEVSSAEVKGVQQKQADPAPLKPLSEACIAGMQAKYLAFSVACPNALCAFSHRDDSVTLFGKIDKIAAGYGRNVGSGPSVRLSASEFGDFSSEGELIFVTNS